MNHFIHTLQSADIEVDAQNLRRHGGNCEWDSFKKSNLKQFCENNEIANDVESKYLRKVTMATTVQID